MVEVCGWVSRWSLEAPFPLRIGDGGSLWVGETVELGSFGSFKRIGDGGSGWVSRWSLEAPFPLRIGDGGNLWMGVMVLMRIRDGSLRFGHGRFRD